MQCLFEIVFLARNEGANVLIGAEKTGEVFIGEQVFVEITEDLIQIILQ
jgi:hypothetical protein